MDVSSQNNINNRMKSFPATITSNVDGRLVHCRQLKRINRSPISVARINTVFMIPLCLYPFLTEPFYIAKCLQQIPEELSTLKYKIKWLEKLNATKEKSCYILSYDDLIHNQTIICKIKLQKMSRFRFILTASEENRIMSIIRSYSKEVGEEEEEASEEHIIHKKKSLELREHVLMTESNGKNNSIQIDIPPKSVWNEVNIIFMKNFRETQSIFNDKNVDISLEKYLEATGVSEVENSTHKKIEVNTERSQENLQDGVNIEKDKDNFQTLLHLIQNETPISEQNSTQKIVEKNTERSRENLQDGVNIEKDKENYQTLVQLIQNEAPIPEQNQTSVVASEEDINRETDKVYMELKNLELQGLEYTEIQNNSSEQDLISVTLPELEQSLGCLNEIFVGADIPELTDKQIDDIGQIPLMAENDEDEDHNFSLSDPEYIPSTDASDDQCESDMEIPFQNTILFPNNNKNENREGEKGKKTDKLKRKRREKKTSSSSETTDSDFSTETEEIFVSYTKKTDENKRVYDKRHSCYFCNKLVCKMTRHLEHVHEKELEVAKLLALGVKDSRRKEGFLCILRAGDYFHNCEVIGTKRGELILSRRPASKEMCLSFRKYGPCPQCLGFFLLKMLWHHVKNNCPKRKKVSEELSENVHNSVSRRDLRGESIALLGNVFNEYSADYRENIITSFRDDDISCFCKEDELIMKFGLLLFEKYNRHQYEYIRQSMRQLGRLLLAVEETNVSKLTLQQCLLPKNFDVLITAVKRLCLSQRTEIHQLDYGVPSLALKLGHSLRKCALIARGIALRKGDLQTDRQMEGFLDLMSIEWNPKVSSAALRTLRHKKMNSPELLPLTDDLVTLNKYLETVIKESLSKIDNSYDPRLWARLATATLSRIILFNKRRSGEASRMTITQYAARPNWKEQSTTELKATLTPLENNLADRLTVVEVLGKSRALMKVPILLTVDMKDAVDKLIQTRIPSGISKDNIYVFARGNKSEGYLRGHDCLRLFCNEVTLQKPRLITSTKLRKYIATVVQLFDLKENEYDWLARHLGHDIRVHREFYRLHESAVELTKVSRILLAVDKGEANQFKGKSLQDINISDLPYAEESDIPSEEESENKNNHNINGSPSEQDLVSVFSTGEARVPIVSGAEPSKKVSTKKLWGKDEKQAVLEFFRVHVRKSIIPKKNEIEECLKKHANLLQNRTWKDIKYCVYNQINLCKKKKK